VSANEIHERLRRGTLIVEFAGVYRVGHAAPSALARYMAAVLGCGKGALLRGRAAAHLHRLLKRAPTCPEVLTPTERRVPGIRTTRSRTQIDPADATIVRGIPVTSVPRTLVDLAADLSPHALAKACHEAGFRYRTTPADVSEVLARRPNAKGAAKLKSIVTGETKISLSRLESRFLSLLRANGLPLPLTNRSAGGRRVDCRWPEHRLTVELDSYTFHNFRHSWEQDRRRERQARSRGDDFARYSWGEVFRTPRVVVREVAGLIYQR
jgi:very-short-patch-repair endonuclease